MRVLIIDNYDSFTFNLVHLIATISQSRPKVVYNNQITIHDIQQDKPDAIILSPGPGNPDCPTDVGIMPDIIKHCTQIPTLGVCLGMQTIAWCFGAQIERLKIPTHGKCSKITHHKQDLFTDLPQSFSVMRYHSLHVNPNTIHSPLCPSAYTSDGIVMALYHQYRPLYGVQFHPESVASEYGLQMIQNFLIITHRYQQNQRLFLNSPTPMNSSIQASANHKNSDYQIESYPCLIDPDVVYGYFLKDKTDSFIWQTQDLDEEKPRFTYMGQAQSYLTGYAHKLCIKNTRSNQQEEHIGDVFLKLQEYIDRHAIKVPSNAAHIPFLGGLLGAVHYEAWELLHQTTPPKTPVFEWLHSRFVWIFDHVQKIIWTVHQEKDLFQKNLLFDWIRETQLSPKTINKRNVLNIKTSPFISPTTEEEYIKKITQILDLIAQGETYEACLTRQQYAHFMGHPWDLYQAIKSTHGARYLGLIRLKNNIIISASPECYLTINSQGIMTTSPIKGTRKRGKNQNEDNQNILDLSTNIKDRAENLMIVDVARHDLGKISTLGSVDVKELLSVKKLTHVLQLTSTINAQLDFTKSHTDALVALFPPASMTGAPKLRSMQHLAKIENQPRGIYSGCMGFLSFHHTTDLAVTIRTLVLKKTNDSTKFIVSLGTGGAIVMDSIPIQEWEETEIKAHAFKEIFNQHSKTKN